MYEESSRVRLSPVLPTAPGSRLQRHGAMAWRNGAILQVIKPLLHAPSSSSSYVAVAVAVAATADC